MPPVVFKTNRLDLPSLSPALSREPTPEPRPQMQRGSSDVWKPSAQNIFAQGIFADPKPVKAFPLGPVVLTDGHKRLVQVLREECGRLYGYNQSTLTRLTEATNKLRHARTQITHLQAEARMADAKITELTAQVMDANASLADMDAAMAQSRAKRHNRLSQVLASDFASEPVSREN